MNMPFTMTALVAVAASVPALSAATAEPAASLILGRWRLDTASMTTPVDTRPASVTAEFADAGAGVWNTTYVIAAKDGSVRRMTSRERLDGRAVAISGDQTDYDHVAMTNPAPGVLVMGLTKSGRLQSVRIYTVSGDGNAMTESATLAGEDGAPTIRRFRWVR